MKATGLEKAVIERELADSELTPRPLRSTVNFDAVTVRKRDFTGVGVFIYFERSEALKLFAAGVNLRLGTRVGARLNASKVETGYVVYVDDGYLTTVEGYTYGGEKWPAQVDQFEVYEAKEGMELNVHPEGSNWRREPNELERALIERIFAAARRALADAKLKPRRSTVDFSAVTWSGRAFTDAGVTTSFERSDALRLFDDGVKLRWAKLGVRLNAKREARCVVHVDDGYVTAVEGRPCDEGEWPAQVDQFELYEL